MKTPSVLVGALVTINISPNQLYLLKWVTGVSLLQLWRDWDPFVIHFPVEGTPHGVPSLSLIPEVIVVDDVDHWAHDGLSVPSDAV